MSVNNGMTNLADFSADVKYLVQNYLHILIQLEHHLNFTTRKFKIHIFAIMYCYQISNIVLSRVLMQEKIIEVLLKFTQVGYLVDQSK